MKNGGIERVAFIDEVHPYLKQKLLERGIVCDDLTKVNADSILNNINKYEGIVIRSRFPVNKLFLDKASKLKFIARSGAGLENIDVDYTKQKGIELFNSPEGNRAAVAEHAIGMLLSLFNHLNSSDKQVRDGIWLREQNRGVELEGKTVGIIGYGNMGSAFAERLQCFGVNVIAYDKYKKGYGNKLVKETDWDQIYKKADVLSLHIPLAEDTLFLMNEKRFSQFKKPIYLINTARGKNVRTKDLITAIEEGKVLGACLDVLEYENTAFEKMESSEEEYKALMKSDKVILSPHVAGWTSESYYKLSAYLFQKIAVRFFDKDRPD
jgi:D-3-phosphoglycerate dehydrogenase